jgi:hypothetical protein
MQAQNHRQSTQAKAIPPEPKGINKAVSHLFSNCGNRASVTGSNQQEGPLASTEKPLALLLRQQIVGVK